MTRKGTARLTKSTPSPVLVVAPDDEPISDRVKSVGNGNLRPFRKGKDPRRGRGPTKGAVRAGRPPDWFREMMREISSREEAIRRLRELTSDRNENDDLFLKAWEKVAERGYPKTPLVELPDPGDGEGVLIWRFGNREIPFR